MQNHLKQEAVLSNALSANLPFSPERLAGIVTEAAKVARANTDVSKFAVEKKRDGSYVTNVDIAVNDFLMVQLPGLVDAIVISEESIPDFKQRKDAPLAWVIDPIDNTKGLVEESLNSSFINVALLSGKDPIMGLVHYFGSNETLLAIKDKGAFRFTDQGMQSLEIPKVEDAVRFVSYKPSLEKMTEMMRNIHELAAPDGVSLVHKYLLPLRLKAIMTGEADVYIEPRRLNEWDVAPAFAFMNVLGGKAVNLSDGSDVKFNNDDLKVGPFMLARPGVDANMILERILPK